MIRVVLLFMVIQTSTCYITPKIICSRWSHISERQSLLLYMSGLAECSYPREGSRLINAFFATCEVTCIIYEASACAASQAWVTPSEENAIYPLQHTVHELRSVTWNQCTFYIEVISLRTSFQCCVLVMERRERVSIREHGCGLAISDHFLLHHWNLLCDDHVYIIKALASWGCIQRLLITCILKNGLL